MALIAQISDLHLRPRGVAALRVAETNMLAERAIDALIAFRPRLDAVIVTGDLTEGALEAEYRLARTLIDRLPMPVFLIPGNHDDPVLMRRAFAGAAWAESVHGERIRYRADIGPLRLIALDSTVRGAGHGALEADDLGFLEAELEAAAGRPVIVAVHHPPIATGLLPMDTIALREPERLAQILARHDNVVRLVCGHIHRMIVASFAGTLVTIAPGTAHQIELALDQPDRFGFNFEPAAFLLHRWDAAAAGGAGAMATHLGYVERFPGPYPFNPERGYAWPFALGGG